MKPSAVKRLALITVSALLVGAVPGSAVGAARPRAITRDDVSGRARPTPDALTNALRAGRLSRAEYALERASTLFDLRSSRARFGQVERPDPHDATQLLRELALFKSRLSGSDRRRASRILARPTQGPRDPEHDGYRPGANPQRRCFDAGGGDRRDVCFHWATATSDATSNAYLADARDAMRDVWRTEIGRLGFKKPQRDLNSPHNGGNGLLDIYFTDIGDQGLYGYCTTDEPRAGDKKTVSAYCVLDNDYDPNQYDAPPPEVNGLDALKVTLAHEFFHAVQFRYDWIEALFLMEGSAVWIEDEVFDSINASYAFLYDSPLHQPEVPLDAYQTNDDENFEYGAFVFFTRLSEAYGAGFPGSAPGVIRGIWRFAGGTKQGMGAVKAVVNRRAYPGPPDRYPGPSTPFRDFFAEWGAANSLYDIFYEEGFDGDCAGAGTYAEVLRCQRPPWDGQFLLGGSQDTTGWRRLPLDRRSNRFVELVPLVTGELTLRVDLPDEARGGEATLVRLENGEAPKMFRVPLNRSGNGSRTVEITSDTYDFHLALTNTGARDNQTYKYKASVQ